MTRIAFPRLAALASCLVLAALLATLLAGCLVPERYIARVKVERDGTYKAYAEGTAVHPEAWRAMNRVNAEARAGKFKPEDLKKAQAEALAPLMKELEALKGDKRIEALSSIGDGRVRFSVGSTWTINRNLLVFSELKTPLAYAVGADGTLRLRVKDAVAGHEARALGVSTEGSLAVTLAEGIEVLEHNAEKAPSSHLGSYRWTIGPGSADAPYLKLRLPESRAEDSSAQSPAPTTQKKLAHH